MLPRRLKLAETFLDVAGGVWWGKRRREPLIIACRVILSIHDYSKGCDVVLADETEPLHTVDKYQAGVWRHVGDGILFMEGLPPYAMMERWSQAALGGQFKYQGTHTRMTEADVGAQLPDGLRYREGLDAVRECVHDARWDEAEKILLMLNDRTPEYLHLIDREVWLTLYEHKPSLRALNMGFA